MAEFGRYTGNNDGTDTSILPLDVPPPRLSPTIGRPPAPDITQVLRPFPNDGASLTTAVPPRPVMDDSRTTVVIPYAGSAVASRTRGLRAWMIAVPMDFAAVVAPLVWVHAYWKGILFTGALTILIFAHGGLYRGRRHLSILDELPGLVGRLLVAAGIVGLIASLRHENVTYVGGFLNTVAMSAGLVLLSRGITRGAVLVARRRRWVEHGALVVGCGPVGEEIARLLRRYPQYGLRFTGFVDDTGPARPSSDLMPWVGRVEDIEQLIISTETDVIIIADVNADDARLMDMARGPACMTCDLLVVPRLHNFQTQAGMPDHIGAIPIMRIRRPTLTGPRWALKRTLDVLLATIALIVLSPVLLLCAIAVFLEGGRGIFFRQQRIGRHGAPFNVIKFRSMKPANEEESQTQWSVATDRRVGPVGRFLRKTSLDELPQLWNILRGDMTFVGPRPERPFFVERFSAEHPNYTSRHRVPAGLTGLAQVSGLRGDTPISDRARFDNYYIENWSLWLDIKVLLRSFAEVFRGGGR